MTESSEEITHETTLIEVSPGLAVVLGEAPEGLDLIDLDLIPSADQQSLAAALTAVGTSSGAAGSVSTAMQSVEGLYRLSDESMQLIRSGAELASKDGAKLGTLMKNSQVHKQALFIPVTNPSVATVVTSLGPTIAMMGLQMQLGEITRLAQTNIALTKQTLKTIRNEQWSELQGLVEAINEATAEARAIDDMTETVWEPVAASGPLIRKQLKLYRRNVSDHLKALRTLKGKARREFLENNASALVFDTHALLSSLKAYSQYQGLRAALARTRIDTDSSEKKLFERITSTTPTELTESLDEVRELTDALTRELRIIAELPGRKAIPLTRKRRDARASRLTSKQLLAAIEPLADKLHPAVELPDSPAVVCAPEDIDLEPYLKILRWFLEDGEELRAIAFPYDAGTRDPVDSVAALLTRRIDASWDALNPGKLSAVLDKATPGQLTAVTDRRLLITTPSYLLRRGQVNQTIPLNEVRFVRSREDHSHSVRPTLSVITQQEDLRWAFPQDANTDQIDGFASLIEAGYTPPTPELES